MLRARSVILQDRAYITCPNMIVAESIANSLVKEKLVACVNIIPSITSIYLWENKIEKTNELLLIAKTQTKLENELINKVKSLHPYDCPEIITTKIENGFPPYLKWIIDSTSN